MKTGIEAIPAFPEKRFNKPEAAKGNGKRNGENNPVPEKFFDCKKPDNKKRF